MIEPSQYMNEPSEYKPDISISITDSDVTASEQTSSVIDSDYSQISLVARVPGSGIFRDPKPNANVGDKYKKVIGTNDEIISESFKDVAA